MPSELLEERAQLRHVLPLWDQTPVSERPLTPFLEQVKEMMFDWALRIREQQQQTTSTPAPEQGPVKIGTGVRQITDDLPRKRTR